MTKQQIAGIIEHAKAFQAELAELETGELLEEQHGLSFSEDEKARLQSLREQLPKLVAQLEKLVR
jgi:hypothetical protein